MILRIIAALFLLCPPCQAGQGMGPGPGVKSYAAAGPSYLLSEDGTGTGWTNTSGVTWGVDGTSLGLDSSAVYVQSLTDAAMRAAYKTITTTGELWVYFKFNASTITIGSGAYKSLLLVKNSGTSVAGVNIYNVSGTYRLLATCGGTGVNTTDAITEDSAYHVLFHYSKGTGSNAVCDVEFSTDGTFAGSGNKYVQKTTGTATKDINRISLEPGWSTGVGIDSYYDKIRVDDVAIGSNPE